MLSSQTKSKVRQAALSSFSMLPTFFHIQTNHAPYKEYDILLFRKKIVSTLTWLHIKFLKHPEGARESNISEVRVIEHLNTYDFVYSILPFQRCQTLVDPLDRLGRHRKKKSDVYKFILKNEVENHQQQKKSKEVLFWSKKKYEVKPHETFTHLINNIFSICCSNFAFTEHPPPHILLSLDEFIIHFFL